MTVAKLIVKNLREVRRDLEKKDKARIKAAQTAAKVEGFRLKKLMTKEIKAGAPGDDKFDPLTEIARRMLGKYSKRARKKDRPFVKSGEKGLADMVRYKYKKQGDGLIVSVGFVDTPRASLSKSWLRIAERQQAGFTTSVSEGMIKFFIAVGSGLSKRSPARKFLFLKKSTRTLRTPARPIIEPFWRAHREEARRNIAKNFARKLAGERI